MSSQTQDAAAGVEAGGDQPADETTCPCCRLPAAVVVNWLSSITGRSRLESARMLRAEVDLIGHNVREQAKSFGLQSHHLNDRMMEFYASTDAFLFETASWNACPMKAKMRADVCQMLAQHLPAGARVLCFGDGMGFDSAAVSLAGFKTTCFEISGPCLKFAERLIAYRGADVEICTDTAKFGANSFDAIVCLDVLEHVEDPRGMLAAFSGWLRPGGMLIAHAPFYHVDSTRPTHLKSNKRFAGLVYSLYRPSGFRLVEVGGWLLDPIALVLGEDGPRPSLWTRVKTFGGQMLCYGARFLPFMPSLAARFAVRVHPKWKQDLDRVVASAEAGSSPAS
ncbi:MAG: class I SAM-dependent methyltransferase [Planctomycetaceae bacterium]